MKIGYIPPPKRAPWSGKKIRAYIAWEDSFARVTVREFVELWARQWGDD